MTLKTSFKLIIKLQIQINSCGVLGFWGENISEEARKKRERVAELKRAQSMKTDVDKDESNDLSKAQLRREAAKIEAEYNSTTKFQRPSTAKKNSQT